MGDWRTQEGHDGLSALAKLKCHPVSGRGMLLSKFYRWFQTRQQIVRRRLDLLSQAYIPQVLTWAVDPATIVLWGWGHS